MKKEFGAITVFDLTDKEGWATLKKLLREGFEEAKPSKRKRQVISINAANPAKNDKRN